MNSRAKKLFLLLAAGLLLASNAFWLPLLNRERATLGITRIEPLENAPPMLALTTQVLGGFRGLIANALWIRATQLQEQGKYFEMVQLADWITKLEPHISQVWLVQSWNMSFNISVKFADYPDRWRWVQRGMSLLRDEGLRYNPDNPALFGELAWLYQFKMGQNMDDAHFYYKGAWAIEMMNVFGGPRPNFEKLIQPVTPDEQARARALREAYKLDPAWMKQVDQNYGPLDWRLPEAHAIYWSSVGLSRARKDEDVRRLRRAIYQSMHLSYQRGMLVLESNAPPRLLPNLAITPKVDAAFREQIAGSELFLTNNMAKAYQNFLKDVPYQFFIVNRMKEAQDWMTYLRKQFPDALAPDTTLAEYAVTRAIETTREPSQVKMNGLVSAFVAQSYYALIEGRDEEAGAYLQRAQELWNAYMNRKNVEQRIALVPMAKLKETVVTELLSTNGPLNAEGRDRLRQALRLPPETPVTK